MSTPSRPEGQYQPPTGPPPAGGPASGAAHPDDLLSQPPAPGAAPQGSVAQSPPQGPAQQGPAAHRAGFDERGKVKRGKISAAWVGLIAAALVLILLIIFIAQNLHNASIHFLGLSGRAPIGLMLLIAAVAGVLLVAAPGSIRILQLRRALKRNTPKDQRLPDSSRR